MIGVRQSDIREMILDYSRIYIGINNIVNRIEKEVDSKDRCEVVGGDRTINDCYELRRVILGLKEEQLRISRLIVVLENCCDGMVRCEREILRNLDEIRNNYSDKSVRAIDLSSTKLVVKIFNKVWANDSRS